MYSQLERYMVQQLNQKEIADSEIEKLALLS
jgi:hypothetical protein